MFSFPGTEPREIAPGALHLPGWLDLAQQRRLAVACHAWARGPVPARAARLPRGGVMSVRTVCLGWHWQPYRYTRTADDAGGGQVAPFPGGWPTWAVPRSPTPTGTRRPPRATGRTPP